MSTREPCQDWETILLREAVKAYNTLEVEYPTTKQGASGSSFRDYILQMGPEEAADLIRGGRPGTSMGKFKEVTLAGAKNGVWEAMRKAIYWEMGYNPKEAPE